VRKRKGGHLPALCLSGWKSARASEVAFHHVRKGVFGGHPFFHQACDLGRMLAYRRWQGLAVILEVVVFCRINQVLRLDRGGGVARGAGGRAGNPRAAAGFDDAAGDYGLDLV